MDRKENTSVQTKAAYIDTSAFATPYLLGTLLGYIARNATSSSLIWPYVDVDVTDMKKYVGIDRQNVCGQAKPFTYVEGT